jgi:protein-S-isoprenylcysteine O-methyltransferase Ste14
MQERKIRRSLSAGRSNVPTYRTILGRKIVHSYRLIHAAVFKIRGMLMAPPLIFICLFFHWEWEHDVAVCALGMPLFSAGLALRIWSQMYLRYRVDGERALARSGPYGWVRNPVYLANILMFAALCILCELPWAIPLVCGWSLAVYCLSIRFEEARLSKRFGHEYEEYFGQTSRWLPHAPGLVAIPTHTIATLHLACRAEWQCALLLLIPVVKEIVGVLWHIE